MSILSTSRLDSQSPKQKVVRFQLDYNLKSLLLDFVTEKDRNLYEDLLCKIRNVGQEIRDDDLTQLLKEARGCISILDTNFRLFVQVVLILRWAHRSDEVVDEYKGFLQELCSAHNYYTKQVLDHLISYFKFDNEDWDGNEPTKESVRCFHNIHQVIRSIDSLIPMSKEMLIASIKKNYPYMKRPSNEHEKFVYNLLEIIKYIPALRVEILNLVITKLITLDTQSPRSELEKISQNAETDEVEEIFHLDTDASAECNDPMQTHPYANSLDVSLRLVFKYIHSICFPEGGEMDWNNTTSLYLDMFKVFESVILPTHATHHVQFLLFYLIGFKPALVTSFLKTLMNKVANPSEAPFIRQASVFYIASLLSRAKYIPVSVVQEKLKEMSNWAHNYISGQEDNLNFDFRLHCVFYTTCQAIFYVIAFRYKELIQGRGLALLQGLNLGKIVTCRLNPLKACVPVVATHFASVARTYQLAYCYTIMEDNARFSLPQIRRDNLGGDMLIQESQLDAFFPFDPYLLIRSYEYIQPHYREYSGGVESETSTPMEADDDSEDDFLEASESKQDTSVPSTFDYSMSPVTSK